MARISSTLTKNPLSTAKVDALVVGVATGPTPGSLVLAPGADDVEKAFKKRLLPALTAVGATGKAGEVTKLATLGATTAPMLVAVGLGEQPAKGKRWNGETLRRAVGAAARQLDGSRRVATALALANGADSPADVTAVVEGALLGGYRFGRYRSTTKPSVESVTVVVGNPRDKAVKAAYDRGRAIADAIELCRDLVNTAPADLYPAVLAQAAVDACTAVGLQVEVLDEKALKKGGFGGVLGVGQGSTHPPRVARITYSAGRGAKAKVHLVGKGITFDSGGLALKPAQSMEWMKSDMGGAAAVLSTMAAIGTLKPDVDVVGWIACAENMPSGTAIRPSDVLTMKGGKTVEVLNPDAEGRLVMADCIAAAGTEKPDYIVDVATLTGAQLVALGSHVYGVMANDDELRDAIVAAAGASGEQGWPMPLPPELRKTLDSDVADIANIGDRNGGMLTAGLFLQEFVPDGVKWAHLDIAGPAFNTGEPHGYTPKGGTGVPVRTLVEWLTSLGS
ncbi:MAG: leucyl aminopeptidase [Frankiaceae bacterium]|nr:leucyl aminopeptidase [Frankiaceae bacterium]